MKYASSGYGSDMKVEWNTGMLTNIKMNYIILDTDYTTRALICSCQNINLGLWSAHRRSCEYLIVSIGIILASLLLHRIIAET